MKLLMNFHTCDVIRVTSQLTVTVPSGIFLPGTELLQSPFRTEFSM